MIDTKWFQDRIKDRGETQRALAHFLGYDSSAVSLLLNGKRRLQMPDAEKIARFLDVPVEEVLRRCGLRLSGKGGTLERMTPAPAERRIPITFRVDPDGNVIAAALGDATAPAPADADSRAVAARMEAGFAPGAAVIYLPPDTIEVDAIGRLAVVRTGDGKVRLGILKPGLDRGLFDLSLPRGNVTGVKVTGATPVLWIRP